MSAELGTPILFAILAFWALFALGAILTTFTRRENVKALKEMIRHLLDPHRHHSERG